MRLQLPQRSIVNAFLLAVAMIPVAIMPLFGVSATCAECDGPISTLPRAETPVLETILDAGSKLLAPFHAWGGFEMPPGRRFELRLRAPYPSTIQIKIENQALPEVKDSASHPELDASGYYRISDVSPLNSSDGRFFWRVFVRLPLEKQGNVDYIMTVHNVSLNETLTGTQKEAEPLSIKVFRTSIAVPKPSSGFFESPDNKHFKFDRGGNDGAFIADNVTLAGWLVVAPFRNPDAGTEDWHYDIWLDNDFIERNYKPSNIEPINSAVIPGRWFTQLDDFFHPKLKIPLTGGGQPDAGTFLLPGTDQFTVELNAWHKSKHNNQVPNRWVADPDPASWPDVFWPFPVMKPFGIGPDEPELQEGDYVIITGALVEDSAHLHWAADFKPQPIDWRHKCWFDTFKGHGGWLEIHPVDSIRRVPRNQAPVVRKHPQLIQLCDLGDGKTPTSIDVKVTPIPSAPPTSKSILRFRELIDDRFTDMSTVQQHVVEVRPQNPVSLSVKISLKPGARGHFKAVYLLWWEEGSTPRPVPVPSPTGDAGPEPEPEDLSVCSKKPFLPQCNNPTLE